MFMYHADCLGQENNCLYPHRLNVTDDASLLEVVRHDYVCAEYKGSYRSNVNFISSDCVAVDFDNDHSEDPEDWVKPRKIVDALPDVTMAFHYSRNHMRIEERKAAETEVPRDDGH